jgi:hypothetical protein
MFLLFLTSMCLSFPSYGSLSTRVWVCDFYKHVFTDKYCFPIKTDYINFFVCDELKICRCDCLSNIYTNRDRNPEGVVG